MSLIIAMKCRGGVLVASDSQATTGSFTTHNSRKIYKNGKNKFIGAVGDLRDADLMAVAPDFSIGKDFPLYKNMVESIVPNLFNYLRKNKRLSETDGIEEAKSTFVYCTAKNIYDIYCDGSVNEYAYYCAAGSGADVARGILDALYRENMPLEEALELIKKIFTIVSNNNAYVDNNIVLNEIKL